MRQEGNPLDLNNLPEDFCSREGKQVLEDTSSSAGGGQIRKKKSGGKQPDGKDDSGKVYECRFCSLKFCKSQALGGHMNRHRQERETETLNRARQLVFSNDNIIAQVPHQLGGQPMVHGGYHHQPGGDPALTFRSSVYPTRLFSGTNTTISPPPPIYTPPTSRLMSAYPSHAQPINDYFVGHVCPGNPPFGLHNFNCTTPEGATNYTCIGAPVGMNGGGGRDVPLPPSNQHRMDLSPINRYQDGF